MIYFWQANAANCNQWIAPAVESGGVGFSGQRLFIGGLSITTQKTNSSQLVTSTPLCNMSHGSHTGTPSAGHNTYGLYCVEQT